MAIEHSDISRMLETAVVAARLAGQRAMEELKYTKASIKNNNEMVTQADPICQKIIIDVSKRRILTTGSLLRKAQAVRCSSNRPEAQSGYGG